MYICLFVQAVCVSKSELLKIAVAERKALQKANSFVKHELLPEISVKFFFGGSLKDAIACQKEFSGLVEGKEQNKALAELQALEKLEHDKLEYEELVSAVLSGAIAEGVFKNIRTIERWNRCDTACKLNTYNNVEEAFLSELRDNVKNPLIVEYISKVFWVLFEVILIAGPQKPLHPLVHAVRKLNLEWKPRT